MYNDNLKNYNFKFQLLNFSYKIHLIQFYNLF